MSGFIGVPGVKPAATSANVSVTDIVGMTESSSFDVSEETLTRVCWGPMGSFVDFSSMATEVLEKSCLCSDCFCDALSGEMSSVTALLELEWMFVV